MTFLSPTLLATILAQTAVSDPDRFNGFLILAYGAIWLVAFTYLLFLSNRQNNARRDLRLMSQLLEEEKEAYTLD